MGTVHLRNLHVQTSSCKLQKCVNIENEITDWKIKIDTEKNY